MDPDPEKPGPWKYLQPGNPEPTKILTLKNLDTEKTRPWNVDVEKTGCRETIRRRSMILIALEICKNFKQD